MAPKIEELDRLEPVKLGKNPFLPKKQTTVKREPDEAYPERKGLNKPQFLGDSPLDLLFQKLETAFEAKLEDTTVESLSLKLFPELLDATPEEQRYRLIDQLLQYLLEIQQYSLDAKEEDKQKKLISISLHDIKTFGKLINLIILLGVYPAISAFHIGVPLEKRRLKDFGKAVYKPLKVAPIAQVKDANSYTERYGPHARLLTLLYDRFFRIFQTESDVRELLMKGSGYSDFLVITITLATVPYFDTEIRSKVLASYDFVTQLPSSYELYLDYSLLVSTPSPPYFKQFVMQKLQLLPCDAPKKDGVLTLIEFVLGLRDQEEIQVEKFDHVANVLLLKPKSVPTVEYFQSIGAQCYELLININRPTITSCVTHFLEKLWYKNSRIAEDFILRKIWDNFNPLPDLDKLVLVSETALNNNINVCLSLLNRGLPHELLLRIFSPIIVPIWSYYTFLRRMEKSSEIAQNVLVSFLVLAATDEAAANEQLLKIAHNVVAEGENGWKYRVGPNQLVEICGDEKDVFKSEGAENKVLQFISLLDSSCKSFMELLKQLDGPMILKLFVQLLRSWINDQQIIPGDENPFVKLVDLRLLENIGNEFKDKLAQSPLEILELVLSLLQYKETQPDEDVNMDSDDEDDDVQGGSLQGEMLTTVLELLSAIITESQPSELDGQCREKLLELQKQLRSKYEGLAPAKALSDRIGYLLEGDVPIDDDTHLQKQAFSRAIANLNDPLVPIRAHGLFLLRQLVEQRSSVLSLEFVVNLHVLQLKDAEPFVYLNAIKGLESLLLWDDRYVLPVLITMYDGEEVENVEAKAGEGSATNIKADLDERLRVGEVLLRYIQAQDEAFSGDMARLVTDGCLKLIRRPNDEEQKVDNRLRMSAMSILGTCCNTNPLGIVRKLEEALDCAIGILQLETDKDSAIMRRSAIVLIHDLIMGTSKTDKVPFPRLYMEKVVVVLRYVQSNDLDLLVREQAQSVLDYIDDLVKIAMAADE